MAEPTLYLKFHSLKSKYDHNRKKQHKKQTRPAYVRNIRK
ncbi:hypothetical protein FM120_36615 [Sphingobacterium faecium PCAi_F2.5]|nr:hypothetical protein FM120_36615 [Sphingobacterium faecium PCAi_F2.5]